jgi:hypothetical protein
MTVFKITPINWYLNNGALIGFITSVVATTWGDINRNVWLISAHPKRYLGACANLLVVPFHSMATQLEPNHTLTKIQSAFNSLLTTIFILIIAGLLIVWFIVVVPLQYIIFLICGAPARDFQQSGWRPVVLLRENDKVIAKKISKTEKIPNGWWDASLFSKPVSITCLISSALFLIVKPLLS